LSADHASGKISPIPIIIAASCIRADGFIVRFINRFINISISQASPHFLMTRTNCRLTLALALSLLLHLAPFLEMLLQPPPKPAPPPPLQAKLRPPPKLPAQIPLVLAKPMPAAAPTKAPPAQKVLTAPTGRRNWQDEIRRQFRQQDERQEFYPIEAIAQGIEGEALILLILDPSGQVVAARIEQSSGQRILDDAALRAVRALRSLPTDAPRETLLPVRFRLR